MVSKNPKVKQRSSKNNRMDPFINPKHIAVIGATSKPNKISSRIIQSLTRSFSGKITLVSLTEKKIFGIPTLPTENELGKDVDLVILAVADHAVMTSIRNLIKKKIRNIVLLTEISNETYEELNNTIAKKEANLSIMGPHSTGVYNPSINLDMIHLPPSVVSRPKKGSLGVIASDHDTGLAFIDIAYQEGIGLSKYINTGDCLDITTAEAINYLIEDSETKAIFVISSYIRNKTDFQKVIDKAWKLGKPLIIYTNLAKTLNSTCGYFQNKYEYIPTEEITKASKKVIQAYYLDHAADLAKAFISNYLPNGNKIAVITNSIGAARFSVDAIYRRDLELAKFSEETKKKIKEEMPSDCQRVNPVYTVSTTLEHHIVKSIKPIIDDPNVDVLLLTLFPTYILLNPTQLGVLLARTLENVTKSVYLVLPPGEDRFLLQAHLENLNLPIYTTAHRASRSIETVLKYKTKKKRIEKGVKEN
ncbi:MAG: CoA-binding protein [Candidatus Ranarchaeia archaeon]